MAKAKKTKDDDFIGCQLKELPADLLLSAAETAQSENPANRPATEQVLKIVRDVVDVPQAIAVLTTKYWGKGGVKLGVYFMDTQDSALKNKILSYMNLWRTKNPKGASVTFTEASRGLAQVRIARENSGYWSYLGTDVLHIPIDQQTMNLQGFTLNTRESEYARVVTHETGHTIGMPHEHLRAEIINKLDRQRTIAYFMQTQGWSQQDVIQQVLTPVSEGALLTPTPADATSIMTYQLPGSITKSGEPIPGGLEINAQDYDYVSRVYPPTIVVPPPPPPTGEGKWRFTATFEVDEATNKPTLVSLAN